MDRVLPGGNNKKVIGLINDKLGGKIMAKFVGLKANTYNYLTDDGSENKNAKSTKKSVMKRKLKFENHENCLKATRLENKRNHLEKIKLA